MIGERGAKHRENFEKNLKVSIARLASTAHEADCTFLPTQAAFFEKIFYIF